MKLIKLIIIFTVPLILTFLLYYLLSASFSFKSQNDQQIKIEFESTDVYYFLSNLLIINSIPRQLCIENKNKVLVHTNSPFLIPNQRTIDTTRMRDDKAGELDLNILFPENNEEIRIKNDQSRCISITKQNFDLSTIEASVEYPSPFISSTITASTMIDTSNTNGHYRLNRNWYWLLVVYLLFFISVSGFVILLKEVAEFIKN